MVFGSPGEQAGEAAEGQALVADLRRRGDGDLLDALLGQVGVAPQQLADALDDEVVGAGLGVHALLAGLAEGGADAVDEDDLLEGSGHGGGLLGGTRICPGARARGSVRLLSGRLAREGPRGERRHAGARATIWTRLPQVSSKHRGDRPVPIDVGGWVKTTPAAVEPGVLGLDVVDREGDEGDAVGDEGLLERLRAAGCSSGSSSSSTPSASSGLTTVSQAVLAERDVVLLHEAEDAGVEVERLGLVVDEHARPGDPHGHGPLVGVVATARAAGPGGRCRGRGRCSGPRAAGGRARPPRATSRCCEIACRLEVRPWVVTMPGAQLEQRLAVPLGQGVEQGPPGGVGERLEQGVRVIHGPRR